MRPCGTEASLLDDSAPSTSSSIAAERRPSRRFSAESHYRPCLASTSAMSSSKAPEVPCKPVTSEDKPLTDVIAGALARAASQSTIHPLDTFKVRLQAGKNKGASGSGMAAVSTPESNGFQLRRLLAEIASLYKGVLGAGIGAGIIIGSYFAFYSTTKKFLRETTELREGSIAFVSGATAAVGSSFIKVPIAVCIRSVQAGVYHNAFHAAKSITNAAGVQGLFTGFLPTLLEDVPDMAVKFAVYESMRTIYAQIFGREPQAAEDLIMGGSAGAAAAASTTPLDVIKTRMMCSASERPTILGSVQGIIAEGQGWKGFFKGVGPRAISNGINSAVFFCFFEAIRKVLIAQSQEKERDKLIKQHLREEDAGNGSDLVASPTSLVVSSSSPSCQRSVSGGSQGTSRTASISLGYHHPISLSGGGNPFAVGNQQMPILSLAIPLPLFHFGHPSWTTPSSS